MPPGTLSFRYTSRLLVEEGPGTLTSAAILPFLSPAGFFLSVIPPRAERPSRMIALVYLGALLLAAGAVTLGVSLL